MRVAKIETAVSHEMLDGFSRNKIYTDLRTIYYLKIAKCEGTTVNHLYSTPAQKWGVYTGGWISLLVYAHTLYCFRWVGEGQLAPVQIVRGDGLHGTSANGKRLLFLPPMWKSSEDFHRGGKNNNRLLMSRALITGDANNRMASFSGPPESRFFDVYTSMHILSTRSCCMHVDKSENGRSVGKCIYYLPLRMLAQAVSCFLLEKGRSHICIRLAINHQNSLVLLQLQ